MTSISNTFLLFCSLLLSVMPVYGFKLKDLAGAIAEEIVNEPQATQSSSNKKVNVDGLNTDGLTITVNISASGVQMVSLVARPNEWGDYGGSRFFTYQQDDLLEAGFDYKNQMAILSPWEGAQPTKCYVFVGRGHLDPRNITYKNIFLVDPSLESAKENNLVKAYLKTAEITNGKFNNVVGVSPLVDSYFNQIVSKVRELDSNLETNVDTNGEPFELAKGKAVFGLNFGMSIAEAREALLNEPSARLIKLGKEYVPEEDRGTIDAIANISGYYYRMKFIYAGDVMSRVEIEPFTNAKNVEHFVTDEEFDNPVDERDRADLYQGGDVPSYADSYTFIRNILCKKYDPLNEEDAYYKIRLGTYLVTHRKRDDSVHVGFNGSSGKVCIFNIGQLNNRFVEDSKSDLEELYEKLRQEVAKAKASESAF